MGDVTNAVKFENWMRYGYLGHQLPPDWRNRVRKLYFDRAVLVEAVSNLVKLGHPIVGGCEIDYNVEARCDCGYEDLRTALAKVEEL